MKRTARLLWIFAICTFAAAQNQVPPEVQQAFLRFSKPALRAHMEFLADDLLEGRGTGTRGQMLAAKYVATQFESYGLEPAGTGGTYFQSVPFREITVVPSACAFSIGEKGHLSFLKWGQDFVMSGNPLEPDASVEAGTVFVGYGVVASKRGYDDYAGVDGKGKIVVLLAGAPPTFPAEERAHFASGREKAREAAGHGAVGVIVLRTPDSEKMLPWNRSVIGAELPGLRWLNKQGVPNDTFKELRATGTLAMSAAPRLFAGAQKSWDAVWRDATSGKPQSFPLKVTVRLHSVSKHRSISSPNVAGVWRGSDPALKNEYVVYTAHTYHLGIGRPLKGDAIYNGAADDASGVSALLELAKAFAALPKRPARSILLLAVTAEEKGLLGSDYYAHEPTVPIHTLVSDINIDGASVFYTFRDIVPLGAEHSTMDEVIARDAQRLGLKVSPDPMPEQVSFIRSDHYSFVRQGVPSISLGEGLEAKDPKVDGRKFVEDWIATRYHSPIDDMNQPLDFDATIQFMQIAFLLGYDLAQQPQRPTWKPDDFFGKLYGGK